MAQINPTVGAIAANAIKIKDAYEEAKSQGADIVLTPELALSGYPPEDLVLRPAFLQRVDAALQDLAKLTLDGPALVVGAPRTRDHYGQTVRTNAAVVMENGEIVAEQDKVHLPNYGVFDEVRVFQSGPMPQPICIAGVMCGLLICEDMWHRDVAKHLQLSGAQILLVLNGSPFDDEKQHQRYDHARARISETSLPLVYVNQVGGQDELVFDGASFVLNGDGVEVANLPAWQEAIQTVTVLQYADGCKIGLGDKAKQLDRWGHLYSALMLGLRDYINKNRFPGIILGLSGGIDSALAAAIAVDAIGPENVTCVMMPSPYTSQDSLDDAEAVAKFLGTPYHSINIGPAMAAFDEMLAPHFAGMTANVTEENIQSRSRGLALMALSNKLGPMVLATGNKSEMSVGYATLYGDMCGGFVVLKDVYKMDVFGLSRWRNGNKPVDGLGPDGQVMPENVIVKPPTAELRPDQKDEDSLPPYERLDAILASLIEDREAPEVVVQKGFAYEEVEKVWRLLLNAEYKRRQSPPGVKTTSLAFGKDRRYPITNGFRD